MRHKWYDVIVAWANGESIQLKSPGCPKWFDLDDYDGSPNFDNPKKDKKYSNEDDFLLSALS